MSQYFYVDKDNNQIDIQNGSQYMWIPVLYQELDFTNGIDPPTEDKYYDMLVAQGTILGSNYKRIQTIKSDKIIQNYYIQPVFIDGLNHSNSNSKLWSGGTITSVGSRVLIDSYDSTYGYVYPVTGDAGFNENTITSETANGFKIYKLGNNYNELADTEKAGIVLSQGSNLIPWKWIDLQANPSASYGQEVYYVKTTDFTKTAYCPVASDLEWVTGETHVFPSQNSTYKITIFGENYPAGISTNDTSYYTYDPATGTITYTDNDANQSISFTYLDSNNNPIGFWKQKSSSVPIGENTRTVLNNQPLAVEGGDGYNYNTSDGSYSSPVEGSPYNGIYIPGYQSSTTFGSNYKYQFNGEEYRRVEVTWTRTSDANSIGSLLNKVVAVNPASELSYVRDQVDGAYVLCANQNIQTNLYTVEGEDISRLRLNVTAFYFIIEQPIQLYSYTQSELDEAGITNTSINSVGIIYYNKPGELLIRPSVGIAQNMKFFAKVLPNQYSTFTIEDIDMELWKIYYTPADVSPIDSDLLYKTDETKFQVKTYFKIGDENPFYLYAEPNITMAFYPVGGGNSFDPSNIFQRAFTVKATYEQESYIQWKSFQYALLDENGKVLQQSPIIYDGEMEYSFYGLDSGNYAVKLVVETDTNYQKIEEENITVALSVSSPESSRMSVEFDCSDCTVKISNEKHQILNLSIYKREIWEGQTNSLYEPVVVLSDYFNIETEGTIEKIISDYNLSNHTYYDYLLRYQIASDVNTVYEEHFPIEINWLGWTLTELTKDYSEDNAYVVDATYVWKFKYNLDIGSQNHNIAKTSQDTLARFPKFSQGVKNYISGQTTCLLGRDVELYNSSNKYSKASYDNGTLTWDDVTGAYRNIGGYKEEMPDALRQRYNRGVDMMEAWKAFCYSGNPKLLKDNKGQTFIVQIHEDSYTIQENWDRRPTTISFSWTEIGDFKKYKISNPLK